MRALWNLIVDLFFALAVFFFLKYAFGSRPAPRPSPARPQAARPPAPPAQAPAPRLPPAAPSAPAKPEKPPRAAPPGKAVISGTVGYPGEGGAEAVRVCAQSYDTGRLHCAERLLYGADGGVRYRLSVPPGNYLVYAEESSAEGSRRGYYTEYVECFRKRAGCSSDSREAIATVVGDGEAAEGVDPVDWAGTPK